MEQSQAQTERLLAVREADLRRLLGKIKSSLKAKKSDFGKHLTMICRAARRVQKAVDLLDKYEKNGLQSESKHSKL